MNIVTGTKLTITEPMFSGSFRNAKHIGDRVWTGSVVKDSYSQINGKHWFTVECSESDDISITVGKTYRRQGKNLYGNSQILSQPEDIQRITEIKRIRKSYVHV